MARKPSSKKCAENNCSGSFYAKNLCARHYKQVRKHGRTLTPEEITESYRKNRAKSSGTLGKTWKIKNTSNMKGHHPKSEFKKGNQSWCKGIKGWVTDEHKEAIRKANTGRTPWNKGKYGWNSGSKNPNWKGGVYSVNYALRRTKRYAAWRKQVFERDNYTCVHCNLRGVYLEADHIKPFAFFPELRFDINNGRTLCKECHMKTPTYKKHKLVEVVS